MFKHFWEAFLAAVAAGYLIVRFRALHIRISADLPQSGPQKFHSDPIPRVGGLQVLTGLVLVAALMTLEPGTDAQGLLLPKLVACVSFAFGVGFAEDITKRISISTRLVFTFVSAALAFFLLDARVSTVGIAGLDDLLSLGFVSFTFTVFAVGGLSHAVNIVDGFNGLAGVVGLLFLAAIAYVAGVVEDEAVLTASLILAGALGGFLIFNFPRGRIFLGDGGAYAVGFLIAELAVLLTQRNSLVSPWFPLVLFLYPVWETFFSIYRKKFIRRMSPGQPDGLHLHMLVHKRLVRQLGAGKPIALAFWKNALTSPIMWGLALVAVVPAVVLWNSTPALEIASASFLVAYMTLYRALVRFHTPGRRWIARRLARTRENLGHTCEGASDSIREQVSGPE